MTDATERLREAADQQVSSYFLPHDDQTIICNRGDLRALLAERDAAVKRAGEAEAAPAAPAASELLASYAGRKPTIDKYAAHRPATLRATIDRLDETDREAADVLVWALWWQVIAENRSKFMCDSFATENARATAAEDRVRVLETLISDAPAIVAEKIASEFKGFWAAEDLVGEIPAMIADALSIKDAGDE